MFRLPKAAYILGGAVAGILLLSTFARAGVPIRLFVNGNQIYPDVPPTIINGRLLVPARAIAEALGAKVGWDSQNGVVTITQYTQDNVKEFTNGVTLTRPSDYINVKIDRGQLPADMSGFTKMRVVSLDNVSPQIVSDVLSDTAEYGHGVFLYNNDTGYNENIDGKSYVIVLLDNDLHIMGYHVVKSGDNNFITDLSAIPQFSDGFTAAVDNGVFTVTINRSKLPQEARNVQYYAAVTTDDVSPGSILGCIDWQNNNKDSLQPYDDASGCSGISDGAKYCVVLLYDGARNLLGYHVAGIGG